MLTWELRVHCSHHHHYYLHYWMNCHEIVRWHGVQRNYPDFGVCITVSFTPVHVIHWNNPASTDWTAKICGPHIHGCLRRNCLLTSSEFTYLIFGSWPNICQINYISNSHRTSLAFILITNPHASPIIVTVLIYAGCWKHRIHHFLNTPWHFFLLPPPAHSWHFFPGQQERSENS